MLISLCKKVFSEYSKKPFLKPGSTIVFCCLPLNNFGYPITHLWVKVIKGILIYIIKEWIYNSGLSQKYGFQVELKSITVSPGSAWVIVTVLWTATMRALCIRAVWVLITRLIKASLNKIASSDIVAVLIIYYRDTGIREYISLTWFWAYSLYLLWQIRSIRQR